jgi:hypothetical protein
MRWRSASKTCATTATATVMVGIFFDVEAHENGRGSVFQLLPKGRPMPEADTIGFSPRSSAEYFSERD